MLGAKSEMVQLQAANSILKLSGMLSDNGTPELDRAKIRKANAEASIVEWKAKELRGDNDSKDKTTLIDDIGGDDNGGD